VSDIGTNILATFDAIGEPQPDQFYNWSKGVAACGTPGLQDVIVLYTDRGGDKYVEIMLRFINGNVLYGRTAHSGPCAEIDTEVPITAVYSPLPNDSLSDSCGYPSMSVHVQAQTLLPT